MKRFLQPIKISELTLSLFGVSVGIVLDKKEAVTERPHQQSNSETQQVSINYEVLRELFTIRELLSDFYFRYSALSEILAYEYNDDEDREIEIANKLFLRVFETYDLLSKKLFSSQYFSLLELNEQSKVMYILDYVLYERVQMEEDENYDLEPDEQVTLVTELINLFEGITDQIEHYQKAVALPA